MEYIRRLRLRYRRSFTLVEIVITIGIIAAISVVSFLSLTSSRGGHDLTNTRNEITALLREAQTRSISQSQSETWGVHLDNTDPSVPFYALFYGTYSTDTRVGNTYTLPPDIYFDPSSVNVYSSSDITFAQITGIPSASTTITLDWVPTGLNLTTSTAVSVSRTGSGKIFFDNFNRYAL